MTVHCCDSLYVIEWSPKTVKTKFLNYNVGMLFKVGHSQKNRVFESGHLSKAGLLLTTESLFTGFSMLTKYCFCSGYWSAGFKVWIIPGLWLSGVFT